MDIEKVIINLIDSIKKNRCPSVIESKGERIKYCIRYSKTVN
jgi:hypothetical protein